MRLREVAVNLLNVFVVAVEGFLGLRFILKLFGANAENGFVDWIYEMSAVLLEPFRGIFPTQVFENQYVLEFSTLFAMLMYALLALLVVAVIDAVAPATTATKKRRKK